MSALNYDCVCQGSMWFILGGAVEKQSEMGSDSVHRAGRPNYFTIL